MFSFFPEIVENSEKLCRWNRHVYFWMSLCYF